MQIPYHIPYNHQLPLIQVSFQPGTTVQYNRVTAYLYSREEIRHLGWSFNLSISYPGLKKTESLLGKRLLEQLPLCLAKEPLLTSTQGSLTPQNKHPHFSPLPLSACTVIKNISFLSSQGKC